MIPLKFYCRIAPSASVRNNLCPTNDFLLYNIYGGHDSGHGNGGYRVFSVQIHCNLASFRALTLSSGTLPSVELQRPVHGPLSRLLAVTSVTPRAIKNNLLLNIPCRSSLPPLYLTFRFESKIPRTAKITVLGRIR